MKITIQYYGMFRNYGQNVILNIDAPTSVQDIKNALVEYLGEQHKVLVTDSVLANENDILSNDFIFDKDCYLSIFPPVCGG